MSLKQARLRSSNTSKIPICAPFCMSFHSSSLSFFEEPALSASQVHLIENMAVDMTGLTSCLSQVLIFDKNTLIGPIWVSCPGTHYWQARFLQGTAVTYGLGLSRRVARKEYRLEKKVKNVHYKGTVLGFKEIVVQKGKPTHQPWTLI